MKDFDSLKNMWEQSAPVNKPATILPVSNDSVNSKMKLQNQQLRGTVMLLVTAFLIACMAIFGNFNFIHWYTYGAMILICLICIIQSGILYTTYKKIKGINDTLSPAAHLQQWEAYYNLRKKQIKWNMPLYYLFLNIAMGIYFIEIFTGRPVMNVLILIVIYLGWMLFSWFYLGKKNLKKENSRLQKIIDELKAIEGQLNNEV